MKRFFLIVLTVAIALTFSACSSWEDHQKDNWPATGNPVSQLFDAAVCASPDNTMPQCH